MSFSIALQSAARRKGYLVLTTIFSLFDGELNPGLAQGEKKERRSDRAQPTALFPVVFDEGGERRAGTLLQVEPVMGVVTQQPVDVVAASFARSGRRTHGTVQLLRLLEVVAAVMVAVVAEVGAGSEDIVHETVEADVSVVVVVVAADDAIVFEKLAVAVDVRLGGAAAINDVFRVAAFVARR